MQSSTYNANTWDEHMQCVIINAKGKSQKAQIFKMVYAETTSEIWKERNMKIFEKRNQSWEAIAREIIYVSCVRAPPRISLLVQSFFFLG